MDINYSFIIPHKNSLQFLNRCLKSIPLRDDIEIIVVDDNSEELEKPLGLNPKIKVIFLDDKNSKGPGRARNVGISQAKGNWLLFPDADDFYVDGFLNILDQYLDRKDLQILFFSCEGADAVTLNPHHCGSLIQEKVETYDGTQESLDKEKYQTHVPWNKMISRKFIFDYGLYYEEVLKNADLKFSFISSFFAKSIEVIPNRLYVYTYNTRGLTFSYRTVANSLSLRVNQMKCKNFFDHIGHSELFKPIPFYNTALSVFRHQGIFSFLSFIFAVIFYHKDTYKTEYDYVSTLESIKTQCLIKGIKQDD